MSYIAVGEDVTPDFLVAKAKLLTAEQAVVEATRKLGATSPYDTKSYTMAKLNLSAAARIRDQASSYLIAVKAAMAAAKPVATTPAPEPFWKSPIVLIGVGVAALLFLRR